MKNIFKIYMRDLKSIFTHIGALIIVGAILILPCLYTWINLKADWDPYGKTNDVQIAIVNNDEGCKIYDYKYNIGNEITNELIKENKYGWNLVSEEKADEGIEEGTYYAKIIIPKDFSKELFGERSVDKDNVDIKYILNQKLNPIASKMADSGANDIKDELNGDIIQSVDKAIFEQLNNLGIKAKEYKPDIIKLLELVKEVNEDLPKIDKSIENVQNGITSSREALNNINNLMPKISKILYQGQDIVNDIRECSKDLKVNGNQVGNVIKQDLDVLISVLNDTKDILNSVDIDKINAGIQAGQTMVTDTAINVLTTIKTKIENGISVINGVDKILSYINSIISNQSLTNIINHFNTISNNLTNANNKIDAMITNIKNKEKIELSSLNDINALVNASYDVVVNIKDNYNNILLPAINNFGDKITSSNNININIAENIDKALPDISNFLGQLDSILKFGDDEFGKLKDVIPSVSNKLELVLNTAKDVSDNYDVDEIVKILENNYEKTGEFFRNPVVIDKESIHSIPNYGSQLAPFFSTLGLWIAGYLLVMLLTTKAKKTKEDLEVSDTQEYFGKLLTFITIGVVQSIILIAGNLFVLGVYVEHPGLLFLLSIFISIVFITILYTFSSVFGIIGKILGIILLVLQLCASGGTFPVEVMSRFYQIINPYLPFKYSIGIMREVSREIAPVALYSNILKLVIFMIVSVLIGVLFKSVVNKCTKKYKEEWENSGFAE